MIKTYALQTLIALASAFATVSLLAAAAQERTVDPGAPPCPVVDSIVAGALPVAAPSPSTPGAGARPADA